jgi:hypothetical protein
VLPIEIAVSIALTGWSDRYCEIDQLEAWYWGTQYQVSGPWHRAHKWTDEVDSAGRYVPLAERAPYDFGIAKTLVDQSTGFLFDEGRFPQILTDGDDSGSEAAEAWLSAIVKHVHLQVRMLEAARIGGRARSVFTYFKVVDGEPILDSHSGKLCTPTFARNGKTLELVRKQYKADGTQFLRMGYVGLDPKKLYWYRCDFTTIGELVYFPVEVKPGPTPPVFIVDEQRSFRHNLGFVSGVWMVNLMRGEDSFDGIGTYDGENVQTVIHLCNEVLSQAHRATRNACDPQFAVDLNPNAEEADVAGIRSQTKGGVWVMPGTLHLHEATGTGQKMAIEQFTRYRKMAGDATGWPETDPETISGKAQSAEALRVLNQGSISYASLLRVCYGDDGLIPLSRVILKVLKALAATTLNVEAYGEDGQPVLASAIPDKPRLRLEWGPWFAPTASDLQATIATAALAVGAGLLSQATAVDVVARLYDRDGDEEFKLIASEQLAKEAQLMQQQQELGDGLAAAKSDGEIT